MSIKTEVLKTVGSMPNDVTLEDIQYHLYVRAKISKSISSVEAGKTYTHDEVEALITSWRK